MTAIVAGQGLGLLNTSLGLLGEQGKLGTAGQGSVGDKVLVNASNGNLVVQQQDEWLIGVGPDVTITRTYNSQGSGTDDNGDNWRLGLNRVITGLTGTINTAGSTIKRVGDDGSETIYTYDPGQSLYVSKAGNGSFDTLSYNAGGWTWTDGDTQNREQYDTVSGFDARLSCVADADGNKITLTYSATSPYLITEIATASASAASAEKVVITYDTAVGKTSNILSMTTTYLDPQGVAQSLKRVSYTYETYNTSFSRLKTVTVELRPVYTGATSTHTTTYTYVDTTGKQLASISQSDGNKVTFTYDTSGRITSFTQVALGQGQLTTFDYSVSGKTTITDPLLQTTELSYSTAGHNQYQLTQIKGPAIGGTSQITQFNYDTDGNVTSLVDARGNTTTYRYDAQGNRTYERDATGHVVERTYSATNLLQQETSYTVADPDGNGAGLPTGAQTTSYVYNAQGHLRFVVSPQKRVTEYKYNSLGQQTSATLYGGALLGSEAITESTLGTWASGQDLTRTQRTDYAYNSRSQLDRVTTYTTINSAGTGGTAAITQYVYDQAGNLLKRVDGYGGLNQTTSYLYDGLNRMVQETNALNQSRSTVYNEFGGLGYLTATIDFNGQTTLNSYDIFGRLISTQRTSDITLATDYGTTSYTYDNLNRLRKVASPTGEQTFYLYDEAGRKVGAIDQSGALTQYIYNANNQLVQTKQWANKVSASVLTALQSDPRKGSMAAGAGLVDVRPAADGANDRLNFNIYDQAGRLVKTIDAAGAVVKYTFDGAGQLVETTHYANLLTAAQLLAVRTSATEVPADDASTIPTTNPNDRHENRYYTADGMLEGLLDGEGAYTENTYDAAARLTKTVRYANLISTWNGATPDRSIKPAVLTQATASGNYVLSQPADDQATQYLYSARGQVIGIIDAENYYTRFTYDAAGNKVLTSRYTNKVQGYFDGRTPPATISSSVTAPGTGSYVRTNPTEDHVTNNFYDELNRLYWTWSRPEYATTEYEYNDAGNLIRQTTSYDQDNAKLNRYDVLGRLTATLSGEGAQQLWDFAHSTPIPLPTELAAQTEFIWATWGTRYTYDNDNRLTSMTEPDGTGGPGLKTLYYYDAVGRKTVSVNALGEVTQYTYSTFGQLISQTQVGKRLDNITLGGLTGGRDTAVNGAIADLIAASTNTTSISRWGYDQRGLVSSVTDALSNIGTRTYNAFGQLLQSIDKVDGSRTLSHTNYYDLSGRRVRVSQAGLGLAARSIEWVELDAFGRVAYSYNPNASADERSYDRLGRLVQIFDRSGAHTSTSYDAFDRVLSTTDALGKTTSYAYDSASLTQTVTTPEGISTTTVRNNYGQVTSVTDGRGTTTAYTYNHDNQLTTTTVTASGANSPLTSSSVAYDQAGRVYETTDARGTVIRTSYDAANRVLTRIVDPGESGLQLTSEYRYDAKGQAVWSRNANGVWTRSTFNLKGELTATVVDPLLIPDAEGSSADFDTNLVDNTAGLNLRTEYTYDAQSHALTVTEGAGTAQAKVTQYTYDVAGRRTQTIEDPGSGKLNLTTTFTYDKKDNVVARTDAKGNVTRYVYDDENRLSYTVDPTGAVTRTEHDANGRLTRTTAYANRIVLDATTVNGASRPALGLGILYYQITERLAANPAKDQVTRLVRDQDGRLTDTIDALGFVTRREYDASGQVTKLTRYAAAAATVTQATSPYGQVSFTVSGTDDADTANQVTQTVYDAAGRAIWSIDAQGYATQRTFDANGNVVKTTRYAEPLLFELETQTQLVRNRAPIVDAPGEADDGYIGSDIERDQTSHTVYDAANRATFQIDAEGYVTQTAYDNLGQVFGVMRYAVAVGYDPEIGGAPQVAPDPQDVLTLYTHDNAGRVTDITDAEQNVTHHTYDAAGRLTDVTTASNTLVPSTTHYVHDGAGRVTEETRAYGNPEQSTTRYVLDALGQRIKTIDSRGIEAAQGNSAWAQAERQRLIGTTVAPNPATQATQYQTLLNAYTTTQVFDAVGHITESVDPLGHSIQSRFDAFGNAVVVTDPNGNSGHFFFDRLNQATLHVDPTGHATETHYDAMGQVSSIVQYANAVQGAPTPGQPPLFFDAPGEATTSGATYYLVKDEAHDATTLIEHDKLGRQTSITDAEGHTESITYDGLGNKSSFTNKLSGTYLYTHDRLGRVMSETAPEQVDGQDVTTRFIYDARGNVLQKIEAAWSAAEQRITTYSYDLLNRQIEQRGEAMEMFYPHVGLLSDEVPVETRHYDARGNLIEVINAGHARTLNYWDALNRKVADIQNGTLTTYEYDAGGDLIRQRVYGETIDLPEVAGGAVPSTTGILDYHETRFTYDAAHRLVATTVTGRSSANPLNGTPGIYVGAVNVETGNYEVRLQELVSTRQYDNNGNLVKDTDANGNVTWHFYDKAGNQIAQVDAGRYLTAWTRDASGNVLHEQRFEQALPTSMALNATVNVDTLVTTASYLGGARAISYVYDRMGRLTQRTVHGVLSSTVNAASGAVTSATADAVTRYDHNGMGQATWQQQATGEELAWQYDLMGRETKRLGAAFVDYEGDTVRQTTDTEYNALGLVARTILRGKDASSESDDSITENTYGKNGVLTSSSTTISATRHAVIYYQYDALGRVAVRSTPRHDANGATCTDVVFYRYDDAGRQVMQQTVTRQGIQTAESAPIDNGEAIQTQEVRYDAYGQIVAKRVYSDEPLPSYSSDERDDWLEWFEYDAAGRLVRTNGQSGVKRAYFYDANGNSTLLVEPGTAVARSSGSTNEIQRDWSIQGLLENMSGTYQTISTYDSRNHLKESFRPTQTPARDAVRPPPLTIINPADATNQVITVGSLGGGANDLGLTDSNGGPASATAILDGAAVVSGAGSLTVSASVNAEYVQGYMQQASGGDVHLTVGWPETYLGTGTYSVKVTYSVYQAILPTAIWSGGSLSGEGIWLLPEYEHPPIVGNHFDNVTDEYYVQNGELWASFTRGKLPHPYRAYFYKATVEVYKNATAGRILIGTVETDPTFVDGLPQNIEDDGDPETNPMFLVHHYAGAVSHGEAESSEHRLHFKGQPGDTANILVYYRDANTLNAEWSAMVLGAGQKLGPGWFAMDYMALDASTYEFRYMALDANGKVLNDQAGMLTVNGVSTQVAQSPQAERQQVQPFLDSAGYLNIPGQGSQAQSVVMSYLTDIANPTWSTITLPLGSAIGSLSLPGWLRFKPSDYTGAANADLLYVLAYKDGANGSGNTVIKMLGSVTADGGTTLNDYRDAPTQVHWQNLPLATTRGLLHYKPSGSSTWASLDLTQSSPGTFTWDILRLLVELSANNSSSANFDLRLACYDENGRLLATNASQLQLGQGSIQAVPGVQAPQAPAHLILNPPFSTATSLQLHYRAPGETPYTNATLTRGTDGLFTLDLSTLAPQQGAIQVEYYYEAFDGAAPLVTPDVDGQVTVPTLGQPASFALTSAQAARADAVLLGIANPQQASRRSQKVNAFGEVVEQTDALGHVTSFSYNAMGKLAEKLEAETNVTLASGMTVRERPSTRYSYDLQGRLVGSEDANHNVTSQILKASGDGEATVVLKEFHADHGTKVYGYDVLGDQRQVDNELNQRTAFEYDKAHQVTRVQRPIRDDSLQGWETYDYDEVGNRIGHHTTATGTDTVSDYTSYDALRRVTGTVSGEGHTTSTTYEEGIYAGGLSNWGTRTTTTDANGRETSDEKDAFGHVTRHTYLNGTYRLYRYDQGGRLVLESDSNEWFPLRYTYYGDGQLQSILSDNTSSIYEYDAEGNKTFEGYARGSEAIFYQMAEIEYDELNRIKLVKDASYQLSYQYDAAGNRRHVQSQLSNGTLEHDYWYLYDSMNRFVVTMGQLSGTAGDTGTTITQGSSGDGQAILYDAAGQRTQVDTARDGHSEKYSYTAEGYLKDVTIKYANSTEYTLASSRTSDLMGRVTHYTEGSTVRDFLYNRDSKVTQDTTDGKTTTYALMNDGTVDHSVFYDGATTVTTTYEYDWYDSARQTTIKIQASNENVARWAPGTSHFIYSSGGVLYEAIDEGAAGGPRSLRYVTNAQGLVLFRDEIGAGGTVNKTQTYFYVNGQRVGETGNDPGASSIDYAQALAQGNNRSYSNWRPQANANFDQNYLPINASYPGFTSSGYTVHSSAETLQSVALAAWGDASLWYLIAEANGMSNSTALAVGQNLVIPNKVTNVHNNSLTHKVYNAAEALGDTSPTLPAAPPPPEKEGCGVLGIIIVVIIAAVVSYYAGPAAGEAVYTGLTAVGVAAETAVAVAQVAGVAIGAAAGSAVSQVAAMAMGMQEHFSWGAVAVAGISAGIADYAGVGPAMTTAENAVGNAVANNLINQGVSMAIGLQKQFSWLSVMASAASAQASQTVGGWLGEDFGNEALGMEGGEIARGTIQGLAGGWAGAMARHDKADWANISGQAIGGSVSQSYWPAAKRKPATKVDSFGGALGDSIVGAIADRDKRQTPAPIEDKSQRGYLKPDGTFGSYKEAAADDSGYFPSRSVQTGQTYSDAYGPVNSFRPTADASGNAFGIYPSDDRGFFPPGAEPESRAEPVPGTMGPRRDGPDAFSDGIAKSFADDVAARKAATSISMTSMDKAHLFLAAGNMAFEGPLGAAFGVVDAGLYARDGQWGNAGASLAGVLPGAMAVSAGQMEKIAAKSAQEARGLSAGREFNLLVNEKSGILSTLSDKGIVEFKINAEKSPVRGSDMFKQMMTHYGAEAKGVLGNWMNRDASSANKNLGVVNQLTAKGMALEEAVTKTWTAGQSAVYGFTQSTIQAVKGTAGHYTKVEVIFTKPK